MKTTAYFLTTIFCISIAACNHKTAPSGMGNYPFEFEGVLEKTAFTTYMYGSHTITAKGEKFALQSTSVNLDRYVNKRVRVKGAKVEGYPVDDGPEFIDVKAVEEK